MTTFPYVRVDFRHRLLSVMLTDRKIAETRQMDDAHLADVDAEGRVVGIEILKLDDLKIEEMAERFGFGEQVPAIHAAIQKVFSPTGTTVSYGKPMVIPGKVIVEESAESEAESDTPTWVIK